MSFLRNMLGTDLVAKAARDALPVPSGPPKSHEMSPRDYIHALGPEALGDEHLGTIGVHYGLFMALSRVPEIASIVQTRVGQVVDFAGLTDDPARNGWMIRMKDRAAKPTAASLKSMKMLADVITRAGKDFQPVSGGFEGFLSAIVRDSLVYDQVNFEVLFAERTKSSSGGRLPVGFVYVDPSTIRRAQPSEDSVKRGRLDPSEKTAYVQVMDDQVVAEYDRRDLAFGVRRPRSWVHARGYGYPELEDLMGVVVNLLRADTWNSKKFTTGVRADQLITLNSDMSSEMFDAVRRIVWAMMSGTSNNQRVPLLQLSPDLKEELKVHPLGHTATEMQFREWTNLLIKKACGLYQMDPSEIGFTFGNEGQTSSLQGADVSEKIAASKERGLHPLLRSIAGWLNEMIVWQWDDAFEFVFTGYDSITPEARLEMDLKAVKAFRSVNEVRASRDDEPLELMAGDVNLFDLPLDATIINAAVQLAAQAGEGDGEGDEGPEGFDEPTDDEPTDDEAKPETAEDPTDGANPEGAEDMGETAEKGGHRHTDGDTYVGNTRGVDDLVSVMAQRFSERAARIQADIRAL